jgi:hypothetical protein
MALLPEQDNEGAGRSLADSSLFRQRMVGRIFFENPSCIFGSSMLYFSPVIQNVDVTITCGRGGIGRRARFRF